MFFKKRKKNNKVLVLAIKEYKRGGENNMGVISASTNFCIFPPEEIKSDS